MWYDRTVSDEVVEECVMAMVENSLHLMRVQEYKRSPHAITYIRLLDQLFEATDLAEYSFDDIANAFNYLITKE